MIYVKRWYLNNSLRNYNYSLVNDVSQTALIIDPTLVDHFVQFCEQNALKPEAILLTHEHGDHVGAAVSLKEKYQLPIYAHFYEFRGVRVDYVITDGENLSFSTADCTVMACPGHTASHVSFYVQEQGLLFCGDTIFTAGVGNLKDSTADVNALYESILRLVSLPGLVKLYPAHDYFENNLLFAQSIDAHDQAFQIWYKKVKDVPAEDKPITSIQDEKSMNIFLRTHEPNLQHILQRSNRKVIDAKSAFCELRARKDVF